MQRSSALKEVGSHRVVTQMLWLGRFAAAFGLSACALTGCAHRQAVPRTILPGGPDLPITPITSWRISGSFRLPDAYQSVYTPQAMEAAFSIDYLKQIGGSESPFLIRRPTTTEKPSFDHDPNDEPWYGSQTLRFYNQTVDFPIPAVDSQVLFRKPGEFFKVMYAASRVYSATARDAVLVVTGDSPMKIWLDNAAIVLPRADSVGHDPTVDHIVPIHLLAGDNSLLVKMFCFPKRNNLAVSVSDRQHAIAFIHAHGGILDVLNQVIVPSGAALSLSDNLKIFETTTPAALSITNFAGHLVRSFDLNLLEHLDVPTAGIADGLYTIHIRLGINQFYEPFYIGNRDTFPLASQPASKEALGAAPFAFREALDGLHQEYSNRDAAFRLGHQKIVVFLMSILASATQPVTEWPRLPRLGAFSYTSKVDDQEQDLLLHLPQGYDGKHSIPIVLVIPHNNPPRSQIVGRSGDDINTMSQLSNLSDEFGFAIAWLHVRGLVYDAPLAYTDTAEATDALEKAYKIDPSRVYLLGDCGAGVNVLSLAEARTSQFAAMSLVNAVTEFQVPSPEDQHWEETSDPKNYLANLANLPIQLIHFVNFPHSPFAHSMDLKNRLNHLGMSPSLIALYGNGWGRDQDPWRLSFEFFRDKSRISRAGKSAQHAVVGPGYWSRLAGVTRETPSHAGVHLAVEGGVRSVGVAPSQGHLLKASETAGQQLLRNIDIDLQKPSPAGNADVCCITGPIADAFASAFILVQGSQGSQREQLNAKVTADRISEAWLNAYGVPLRRMTDKQVSATDINGFNLVLVGSRVSNSILNEIWEALPLDVSSEGVTVAGDRIEGADIGVALDYPDPLNTGRYIVVVTTNGDGPVNIPDFNLSRVGKYDVGIWSSDGTGFDLLKYGYWNRSRDELVQPQGH